MLFILKKPHYRLIFATALVMLSGWIISASYLYLVTDSIAKNEAQITARHTARQAAMTIQPYMLAEDIISLNFYLNSLTEARQINGVAIYNNQSKLYSNYEPQKRLLTGLLWQVSTLSIITLLATLVTLWLALKPLKISTNEAKESDEPSHTPIETEETAKTAGTADTPSASEEEPEHTEGLGTDSFVQTLKETLENGSPTPDQDAEPADTHDTTYVDETSDQSNSGSTALLQGHEETLEETLNNDELVALLKPDTTQRMPHFIPTPIEPDEEERGPQQHRQHDAPYELEERQQDISSPIPAPVQLNPLRTHERTEEQLDLYSLDHQLELSLPPQDAAYLFYIDATTGHADYVEPEEHNYLLQTYEKLINKVSAIYGGVVSIDASGDLQLFFDDQDEEDGHGVHALCAAKLFTLLYRAFNQARIKSFKPVLNLHMAIVRGNRAKLNLIKEEALFLTRTTQSNELISHTALTEARQLKTTLLSSADIRREDEDKVLILSLTASYQALLNKQATHLLSKPATEPETSDEQTADH